MTSRELLGEFETWSLQLRDTEDCAQLRAGRITADYEGQANSLWDIEEGLIASMVDLGEAVLRLTCASKVCMIISYGGNLNCGCVCVFWGVTEETGLELF